MKTYMLPNVSTTRGSTLSSSRSTQTTFLYSSIMSRGDMDPSDVTAPHSIWLLATKMHSAVGSAVLSKTNEIYHSGSKTASTVKIFLSDHTNTFSQRC